MPSPSELYPLSLHDALPIWFGQPFQHGVAERQVVGFVRLRRQLLPGGLDELRRQIGLGKTLSGAVRSEEHTSELQSRENLVCRLLLEKKKKHSTSSSTGGDH